MKKIFIKNIAVLMAAIMLLTAMPFAFSASAMEEVIEGTIGDFTWTLDKETGVLEISGEGVFTNPDEAWANYYPYINHAIVSDGITEIGDDAFYNCRSLMTVELPDNITRIGEFAFGECFSLQAIEIPETVTEIGDCAFADCLSLETFSLSANLKKIGWGAFGNCQSLGDVYIYGKDTVLEEWSLGFIDESVDTSKITVAEFTENYRRAMKALAEGDFETASAIMENMGDCMSDDEYTSETLLIHCYKGSLAEAYAKENSINYINFVCQKHSFGDWVNDFDNLERTRTCEACNTPETEKLEATTENGDVEIVAPVNPDTEFTVDEIETDGKEYIIIEEAVSNNITNNWEIVKAFDINLTDKDGVHVQPDGTVKVKLPLDWSKEGNYKVYRVNDDGTLTDMDAYRQGSHMVFDTDHFSIYIIVEESEKIEEPVIPDQPQETPKKSFFEKVMDWFNSFIELIFSWFKR